MKLVEEDGERADQLRKEDEAIIGIGELRENRYLLSVIFPILILGFWSEVFLALSIFLTAIAALYFFLRIPDPNILKNIQDERDAARCHLRDRELTHTPTIDRET